MRVYVAFCALALGSCQPQQDTAEPAAASLPPSAAGGACGAKGQQDCPLQGWMKSTMQPYQKDKEYERLAGAFEKLAQNTPAGYDSWKTISETGASAAKAEDDAAVSKACKSCHNEHRSKFRKERRAVPLFD